MKRIIKMQIKGIAFAAIALILSVSLQPGVITSASTGQPQVSEGLVVPPQDASQPNQPAAPQAMVGITQTYGSYEFQPADSALTFSPLGAGLYADIIPGGGIGFKCPLHLPNGAQVTSISFFVVDNSPAANMTLQ